MVTGSLTLDDVSKRYRMLEVRCGICPRRGRLRIDKLIDEHGRDMSLPDLRAILAGDCELKAAVRREGTLRGGTARPAEASGDPGRRCGRLQPDSYAV